MYNFHDVFEEDNEKVESCFYNDEIMEIKPRALRSNTYTFIFNNKKNILLYLNKNYYKLSHIYDII